MSRIDGRKNDELRPIEIIPNINKFAEGSCLIRCGNTHVLCTASVEDKPPRHVPEGEGWVTAESVSYTHLDNSVGTPELIRYDYFNLEDRRIFRDHEPLITPAPACSEGDGFYYRMKKLSFTKLEEVERRGERCV